MKKLALLVISLIIVLATAVILFSVNHVYMGMFLGSLFTLSKNLGVVLTPQIVSYFSIAMCLIWIIGILILYKKNNNVGVVVFLLLVITHFFFYHYTCRKHGSHIGQVLRSTLKYYIPDISAGKISLDELPPFPRKKTTNTATGRLDRVYFIYLDRTFHLSFAVWVFTFLHYLSTTKPSPDPPD